MPHLHRSYNTVTTSFADLGVPARLIEALAADGITEPFPVQAITLPDALAGKDLCGRAPTGSGKTLGFGIPMMVRISQAEPTKPTGLVLVPTRELAEQVQRAFVPLGRAQWRFIQAIYGGASFGPQIHSLRKGASVVVATPGRLLDIIEKGYCDLSAVEVCVIDEADRMADLGFMPDVRKILDMTPATRQTMLWSATLDGDVNELIRDYMNNPVRHDLMDDADAAPVDHKFVVTRPSDRLDAAVALIEEHGPTIVFVKTRFGVDDVSEDLNRAGVKAGALHGARSQAVRQRTLEDFKRGRLQALVATDVAARGIHVDNVSLVLHYDMPDNDKDYTHRSGRTGRAGNAGLVIAFVPPSRQRIAQRMSDSVSADVSWEHGEKPVERVPAAERETGTRDRGDRERGGYAGRGDRPSYGDRPSSGDRAPRGDRPAYGDRAPRGDRPSYGDRAPRGDRPAYGDRAPRSDRPAYGDRPARGDRPAYNSDRPSSGDRPSYN
ncbi:MAG TPA: DEAD/DEAH box helicase, partial [Ilumatobacteraceae bacterium]